MKTAEQIGETVANLLNCRILGRADQENLKAAIEEIRDYGDARIDAMIDEMAASGMDDPISQKIRNKALEEAAVLVACQESNARMFGIAEQIRRLKS